MLACRRVCVFSTWCDYYCYCLAVLPPNTRVRTAAPLSRTTSETRTCQNLSALALAAVSESVSVTAVTSRRRAHSAFDLRGDTAVPFRSSAYYHPLLPTLALAHDPCTRYNPRLSTLQLNLCVVSCNCHKRVFARVRLPLRECVSLKSVIPSIRVICAVHITNVTDRDCTQIAQYVSCVIQ